LMLDASWSGRLNPCDANGTIEASRTRTSSGMPPVA
jgi:hypothetical protein